jgi:phosphoglycolate phosphatase-like HAD superfamily hydrolase
MIQKIMQAVGVSDVEHVMKVGDTTVDIEEGRLAGCGLVVAVTTGAQSREELLRASPDRIIDGLNELFDSI